MARSLAERLEAARQMQFVGRTRERDLLRTALTSAELPFALIYIFGPGGTGKTSLLREASTLAAQNEVPAHWLDGRNLEASPGGFLGELQLTLGVARPDSVYDAMAAGERRLLLIDTAELLTPLDGWLRDAFMPQLPGNVLVVIAGRNPPSLRWRTDPGWQQLMHVIQLKNLNAEESRALLMRRQIPARHHEAILRFTHGHPLALSLVSDVFVQQPETEFQPENVPDIIKTLLEQFMQEVPSPNHRAALEACSQVRLMNEPLLGAMLQIEDPHPVFEWLRGLSFIESDKRGLYPHDLTREALTADLRWRDPERQEALHALARGYYMRHFQQGDGRQQRQILSDYIFLHRQNPIIQAHFDWQSSGTVFTDFYRDSDEAGLLEMVKRHEGETAVQLARHWLKKQPLRMTVLRQAGGEAQGLLLMLALEKCSAADRALDPAVEAACAYLDAYAPMRPGETATLFRFWMAADSYQAISPVQSRIFLNIVQHYLTTPGLAFTMIPCAEPEMWRDVFGFADLARLPEADFEIDGRSFGVYGHDWRTMPPMLWLARMAKRELGLDVDELVTEHAPLPLQVMDRDAFAEAVQAALRHFTNDVALQENRLLNGRLVTTTAGINASKVEQVAQLRVLLTEAAETMQGHPKHVKWHRALHHTYLQPAPTQEKAAELLDLPFSTYRRYLRAAVEHVTDWLWAREVGE